jgi:hypothetical protein
LRARSSWPPNGSRNRPPMGFERQRVDGEVAAGEVRHEVAVESDRLRPASVHVRALCPEGGHLHLAVGDEHGHRSVGDARRDDAPERASPPARAPRRWRRPSPSAAAREQIAHAAADEPGLVPGRQESLQERSHPRGDDRPGEVLGSGCIGAQPATSARGFACLPGWHQSAGAALAAAGIDDLPRPFSRAMRPSILPS